MTLLFGSQLSENVGCFGLSTVPNIISKDILWLNNISWINWKCSRSEKRIHSRPKSLYRNSSNSSQPFNLCHDPSLQDRHKTDDLKNRADTVAINYTNGRKNWPAIQKLVQCVQVLFKRQHQISITECMSYLCKPNKMSWIKHPQAHKNMIRTISTKGNVPVRVQRLGCDND